MKTLLDKDRNAMLSRAAKAATQFGQSVVEEALGVKRLPDDVCEMRMVTEVRDYLGRYYDRLVGVYGQRFQLGDQIRVGVALRQVCPSVVTACGGPPPLWRGDEGQLGWVTRYIADDDEYEILTTGGLRRIAQCIEIVASPNAHVVGSPCFLNALSLAMQAMEGKR